MHTHRFAIGQGDPYVIIRLFIRYRVVQVIDKSICFVGNHAALAAAAAPATG